MTDPDPVAAVVERLYAEYAASIFRHILRRTSDKERAEDLTHDVFAKLLAALRGGTQVKHNGGFLFRIAHNLIIDYYRDRDLRPTASLDSMLLSATVNMTHTNDQWTPDIDAIPLMAAPGNLEADTVARLDRDETLRHVCHSLTDLQTAVIHLRYFEARAFGEIADKLETTPGAVKALQHRALETMRVRSR